MLADGSAGFLTVGFREFDSSCGSAADGEENLGHLAQFLSFFA
jgi:hypothetical protein